MQTVKGFACNNPKEDLRPFSYDIKELGDHEVALKISHCGVCHSDIHLIDNDWHVSRYPFIPGHEIVGFIIALGKAVKDRKIGQRVGIGWQRSSCHRCEFCTAGNEHYCLRREATCVANHGGYADAIAVDYNFAIPVPDALPSAMAAPLLCGGITVFSPLRTHGITDKHKVGVLGVGGLGHMAIMFAAAMGCDVTALSSNPKKQAETQTLGAKKFLLTSDAEAMRKAAMSLDFILYTASGTIDLPIYLNLLKPRGKLCVISGSTEALQVYPDSLITGERSVVGSMIGPPARIQEMLEFAAKHKVHPKIEVMPLARVNEALTRVRKGDVRYRMVLEMPT